MVPPTSKKVNEPGLLNLSLYTSLDYDDITDKEKKKREIELEREITQLKLRIRERDRTIFDLEEQIRGKDAIIVDRCQLIERLEQFHFERSSPDKDSLEEKSESTVKYVNVNENDALKTEQEAQLLEELEEERKFKVKLMEQNALLLQQWDEALAYVEQVQKMLQAELRRTSTLIDENATLRKRINETLVISKNGIQFVALLLVLSSLYLYSWS
ncbi:unnamed protein product [Brugia pahangi]|uniref:Uncharacterized protein n=1 Tax=Brugia pahangi TaxID=6280 RepID=A0A0N4T4A7_BRUPA|nr:unnamed protein product [Brugia pahangi]